MKTAITITREGSITKVEGFLICSGSRMLCEMSASDGDNASAKFNLMIEEGGQVEKGCDLKLCGPCERGDLLLFLESIVEEMKRSK